ncbi:uncharacterized protein LOC115625761 [Scaptodrosophila lebanonensis]|uniref:Uncharacterized protein LOC115625761 n=1 Tax=Drosophila lebanonensis TaxID=7225 RepID=A0A6J2TL71_DROLE|nr:uncharacterized protein LOC115625761 [Scaptodrosophila lebanonensis]
MLISCKCLNFIATSPQLQRNKSTTGDANVGKASVIASVFEVFKQKWPRNFLFYTQCMEFFQHTYGPIPDLTINSINQRDLIYSLTINAAVQTWQLSLCINCKVVLCAKCLTTSEKPAPSLYLINSSLFTTNEEMLQRRSDKSYSETFELLIMDHKQIPDANSASTPCQSGAMVPSTLNLSIGSMSSNSLAPLDGRQIRLRQLQAHQQARLQREITETNARIERYTEQQFALLKSFRDKCDQDCALLMRVIQNVPEKATELLDRGMPSALEVTGSAIVTSTAAPATRRRSTISSRSDLITVSTTPTNSLTQPPSFLTLPVQETTQRNKQQKPQPFSQQIPNTSNLTSRKLSNFDTPPATPEATPMSVSNSPTFRQQAAPPSNSTLLVSATDPMIAGDMADNCQFDMEDVDDPIPVHSARSLNFARSQIYQHQPFSRQQQLQIQYGQHDDMSDLDESEAADQAEDALNLDNSMPIHNAGSRSSKAHILNFAKSLPIEISNSPLAERANNNFVVEDEEILENTVDIAASIKALAKSLHGEAVFGDLPRPRLRSQI